MTSPSQLWCSVASCSLFHSSKAVVGFWVITLSTRTFQSELGTAHFILALFSDLRNYRTSLCDGGHCPAGDMLADCRPGTRYCRRRFWWTLHSLWYVAKQEVQVLLPQTTGLPPPFTDICTCFGFSPGPVWWETSDQNQSNLLLSLKGALDWFSPVKIRASVDYKKKGL